MLFNSPIFLFLFLPLALVGFFLFARSLGRNAALGFLLFACLVFYAYSSLSNFVLLLVSIAANYAFGYAIARFRQDFPDLATAAERMERNPFPASIEVRLAPCGEAATRLVDADGKPLVGHSLWLELTVTPGASSYDLNRLYEKGEMAADSEYVANIDRVNYKDPPLTDKEGRITFAALIPGATYRIVEIGDRDDMIKCEFKAESGKTVKLPDVVRKK